MSTPATFKNSEKPKPLGDQQASRNNNNNNYIKGKRYTPRRVDFSKDVDGGKQYTSFEKRGQDQRDRKPRPERAPINLTPQKVEDVPIEVDTDDYKVDAENIVIFNGRLHFLSTMHATPVLVDGHEYSSIEHYYQATKLFMLGGPLLSQKMKKITDPGQAKFIARKLLRGVATTEQIEKWKRSEAPNILFHALLQKYMQHSKLKEQLLSTGDAVLAHTYDRDNVFATGCDEEGVKKWAQENNGSIIKIPQILTTTENYSYIPLVGSGKNVLGAICMQVRKKLLLQKATAASDADKLDPSIASLSLN